MKRYRNKEESLRSKSIDRTECLSVKHPLFRQTQKFIIQVKSFVFLGVKFGLGSGICLVVLFYFVQRKREKNDTRVLGTILWGGSRNIPNDSMKNCREQDFYALKVNIHRLFYLRHKIIKLLFSNYPYKIHKLQHIRRLDKENLKNVVFYLRSPEPAPSRTA